MLTLPFLETGTGLVMIVCGLIGFLFSSDRVLGFLHLVNTKDKDSRALKYLDIVAGILALVWLTLLVVDEKAEFSWVTVVAFILFMVVSFAHPAKDLEGWELILLAMPFVFITIVAYWFHSDKQISFFGINIPVLLLLGIVALIMIIIFLVVFFVEETFVDPVLYFLGWAPVVIVVSVFIIVQGVALYIYPDHQAGLATFLLLLH